MQISDFSHTFSALGNVITVTYAASRVNQGEIHITVDFIYQVTQRRRHRLRARQRGCTSAIWKQVLGIELANRQIASSRIDCSPHSFSTPSVIISSSFAYF